MSPQFDEIVVEKLDSNLVTIPAIKTFPKGYSVAIQPHGTIDKTQFMDKLFKYWMETFYENLKFAKLESQLQVIIIS